MEPLSLAIMLLLLAPSQQVMEDLDDILVYPIEAPRNIEKRAAPYNRREREFIEEKLIQHSQALEQLVKMVGEHGEITRRLVENISKSIEKPKMPDAVEFSRRSLNGKRVSVSSITPSAKTPWCELSITCKRTVNPVCGYDDNFGYGRFDDYCHMLQVNCFWKYNFSLVDSCKPK